MGIPSVTYTFANGTASDAAQVNQNFTDMIAAMTDGTSDFTIGSIEVTGAAIFDGNVTVGNSSVDTVEIKASLKSSIVPDTDSSYSFGSATYAMLSLYLSANSKYVRIMAHPAGTGNWTCYMPPAAGTENQLFSLDSSGYGKWANPARLQTYTFTTAGNWTAPSGCYYVGVYGCGGGGGGGGGESEATASEATGGDGGNGAPIGERYIDVVPGTSYSIVVGAGGSGAVGVTGDVIGANGTDGTVSRFSSFVTFQGGIGGCGGANTYGRDTHVTRYYGCQFMGGYGGVSGANGYKGANSIYKAGGGGAVATNIGGAGGGGGACFGDGGAGAAGGGNDASNGSVYGAGGGGGGARIGSALGGAGGNGAQGIIIIKWVA